MHCSSSKGRYGEQLMAIKAVYFDLDNTLVDRTASIERFATMFIEKYGSRLYKHSPESISSIIRL